MLSTRFGKGICIILWLYIIYFLWSFSVIVTGVDNANERHRNRVTRKQGEKDIKEEIWTYQEPSLIQIIYQCFSGQCAPQDRKPGLPPTQNLNQLTWSCRISNFFLRHKSGPGTTPHFCPALFEVSSVPYLRLSLETVWCCIVGNPERLAEFHIAETHALTLPEWQDLYRKQSSLSNLGAYTSITFNVSHRFRV